MSETLLYGVLTFLLILMPLVLIHEAGHFFTAKLFKVKVLEFGFGFPPKIIGFWTGRTEIKTSSKIIQEIEVGKLLGKVLTFEIGFFDERKLVESVREVRTSDFNTITKDDSIIVGKLRSTGPHNLIISDMSPNTTGNKSLDSYRSAELCLKAMEYSKKILKEDGVFLSKFFMGKEFKDIEKQAKNSFKTFIKYKPMASRKESREMYILCKHIIN